MTFSHINTYYETATNIAVFSSYLCTIKKPKPP